MEPVKGDSNKRLNENQQKNKDLMFHSDDSDEESDFDLDLLNDLEDVETGHFFPRLREPYKVMSEAEIRQCQEQDIKNISDILSVSRAEASLLLLHFNWNVNGVPEIWFTNGQKLREQLGLSNFPIVGVESSNVKDMTCGICSGTFSQELTAAALCGHIFCNTCWAGYIGTSIKDGMECLMLRCPDPICSAAVGQDMINVLASDDDKDTYARYFLRSYIDYNPKANWCPAFGCNYAVILVSDNSGSKVTCKCSNSFCLTCTKESHQPISCAAVTNWETESLVQSENWTIANTKGCPNCGQSVEVKGRCKHLECALCKLQFCKLCLASWLEHGIREGDDYTHVCSEERLKQPDIKEEEERVKVAQQSVNRYHSRQLQWKTNDMHIQADLEEIQKLQDGQLKAIANKQGLTEADMIFVKEAWLQIVDCKRFFKWACVYDYYLVDYETEKRFLFNYLLRRAEIMLEHLYQCATGLATFLNIDGPSDEFIAFRAQLFSQTCVNKNYFSNMAWVIENNITSMNALRRAMRSRKLGITASAARNDECRALHHGQPWDCAQCQFKNDASSSTCVMCYHN